MQQIADVRRIWFQSTANIVPVIEKISVQVQGLKVAWAVIETAGRAKTGKSVVS